MFGAMFLTVLVTPMPGVVIRDLYGAVPPASPIWQDVFPWLLLALVWRWLYTVIRRARPQP